MSGPVALVTGSGSGIGRAITERLLADGMTVVATDIDGGAAARVAPSSFPLDVADAAQVDVVVSQVLDHWGRIDVLVNNAGIIGSMAPTTAHETPVEEFDRVIAVNTRGPFLCARAVLPSMVAAARGHIITIASIAGMVAFPGRCAYTVSKGAALQLARSLAVDYGRFGVRSNAICPGMVRTPMIQWRLDHDDMRTWVEDQIPLGRLAVPEEIADAVSVLASGRLAYANGAPVILDGGLTAR